MSDSSLLKRNVLDASCRAFPVKLTTDFTSATTDVYSQLTELFCYSAVIRVTTVYLHMHY